MKAEYPDIKKVMGKPLWYDENGVPRYTEYVLEELPNIYADFAVAGECKCQGCGQTFSVCISLTKSRIFLVKHKHSDWELNEEYFNYGDPPIHNSSDGHKCVGNTMSSDMEDLTYWELGYGDSLELTFEELKNKLKL